MSANTVGEAMTRHPWVIEEDQPLRVARHVMAEHGIRHLPVVRAGRCVGLLTDRDVNRALNPDVGLPPLDELFVSDACRYAPYAVPPGEPLAVVLKHMAHRHIGSAIVLDAGRVLGIFTASDACRLLAGYLEGQPATRSAG